MGIVTMASRSEVRLGKSSRDLDNLQYQSRTDTRLDRHGRYQKANCAKKNREPTGQDGASVQMVIVEESPDGRGLAARAAKERECGGGWKMRREPASTTRHKRHKRQRQSQKQRQAQGWMDKEEGAKRDD
ncbi:hypothetical protein NPX13_g5318 [Xylaria arbuscula]|uniref:Uncharacterized protein n=1 Tax=Xylaria arbuscula TaxID=114810 RepID=A0A9W8NDV6_9PEZI|nr:hypothetical protein NPX13_g5318 [Xylaria arbuscula]